MRLRIATGAQAIVQLGMAFGIDPKRQTAGDVLVSTSIVPYDNREIRTRPYSVRRFLCGETYQTDYSGVTQEPARPALVELFRREQRRAGHPFQAYFGAMLSGAARIHSGAFRDELVRGIPSGEDPIIGGEMEGVGLLAASTSADSPVWCVVKGISDFADKHRHHVIEVNRPIACRNAAEFLVSALINDAKAGPEISERQIDDQS